MGNRLTSREMDEKEEYDSWPRSAVDPKIVDTLSQEMLAEIYLRLDEIVRKDEHEHI